MELGLAKERRDAAESRRIGFSQRRPEYWYSPTLDTCIYEENGWSPELETHQVVDLLTNRLLAVADIGYREEASFKTQKLTEYRIEREKLFASCAGTPAAGTTTSTNPDSDIDPLGLFSREENAKRRAQKSKPQ